MKHPSTLAALVAALACAACSETQLTPPQPEAAAPLSAGPPSPADLSGSWNWSNEEIVKFPPFLAFLLGVVPEGPNTHARCESAGTMTVSQSGSTFQGVAVKTFNQCLTNGGQIFQQPSTTLFVKDGTVRGVGLSFSFESATVRPCPHRATISESQNGLALALRGTGHCFLPGHPKSESPNAAPPPGGTTKTVHWEASRP